MQIQKALTDKYKQSFMRKRLVMSYSKGKWIVEFQNIHDGFFCLVHFCYNAEPFA